MDNKNRRNWNTTKLMKKFYALSWISELFHRYYHGETNDKEKKIVETWNSNIDEELNSDDIVEHSKATCDKEGMWNYISTEFGLEKQAKRIKRLYSIQKYAAIAILTLITIGGAFWFHQNLLKTDSFFSMSNTSEAKEYYETTAEAVRKIVLADGSKIKINKSSKLSIIKSEYNKEKREIWIDEGEAYFEVTPNPEKPFIVHSGDMQTTVRGTVFNVKAYTSLNEYVVSVKEGKVEVGEQNMVYGVLLANKQLNYNKGTQKAEITDVRWVDACGWIDNRLVLNRANINELKLRVYQQYRKEVVIENNSSKLKDMLFTSSFDRGTKIEHVFDVIGSMYDIEYKITDSQVLIYN